MAAHRLSIVSQKMRQLRIQNTEIRLAKQSAVRSFDSSALHPDFRIKDRPEAHIALAVHSSRTVVDAGERFVAQARSVESRLQMDALFAAHGVELEPQMETQLEHAICSFVEAGAGVALVDAVSAWGFSSKGVIFKPFTPELTIDFAVLTPSQRPPPLLLTSFIAHIREFAVAKLGPGLVSTLIPA